MANKREYIERLQLAIEQLHKSWAVHIHTYPVHETFQGQTVWKGEVEAFSLSKHSKATVCYAWSYQDESGEHIATVLRVSPVNTAVDAVRAHIVGESKKRKAE